MIRAKGRGCQPVSVSKLVVDPEAQRPLEFALGSDRRCTAWMRGVPDAVELAEGVGGIVLFGKPAREDIGVFDRHARALPRVGQHRMRRLAGLLDSTVVQLSVSGRVKRLPEPGLWIGKGAQSHRDRRAPTRLPRPFMPARATDTRE